MSKKMRAKMKVKSVAKESGFETITFTAVTNGTAEDNTFAKFTPNGTISLTVTNPELMGVYEPDQVFYVDFEPA